MQRCYIHPNQWNPTALPLAPGEQHHLLHVLRLPENTLIRAFDGQGREADTRLSPPDASGQAYLRVEQLRTTSQTSPQWILVPAIIKGSRMDSLIEKATELGTQKIMPIQTDRCVVRLDQKQAPSKVARWERIAISAAKQCGTARLPAIEPVTNLDGALQALQQSNTPILQGSLAGNPIPLATAVRTWTAKPTKALAILIGPEGDFTPDEYAQAKAAGAIPVSLGPLTLRAETATIFTLSVLQALWAEQNNPS